MFLTNQQVVFRKRLIDCNSTFKHMVKDGKTEKAKGFTPYLLVASSFKAGEGGEWRKEQPMWEEEQRSKKGKSPDFHNSSNLKSKSL